MGGGRSCRCVSPAGLLEEWPQGSPGLEPAAVFSLEEFLGADWLGGAPITPASLCAKILGSGGENTVEPRSVLETFLRDTAARCWMVFLSLTASEGSLRLRSSLGSGCSPVLGGGRPVRPPTGCSGEVQPGGRGRLCLPVASHRAGLGAAGGSAAASSPGSGVQHVVGAVWSPQGAGAGSSSPAAHLRTSQEPPRGRCHCAELVPVYLLLSAGGCGATSMVVGRKGPPNDCVLGDPLPGIVGTTYPAASLVASGST